MSSIASFNLTQSTESTFPKWTRNVLILAAAYNILFGLIVVIFPNLFFNWAGMPVPAYPMIWQCVGMIVGLYGLGYYIAAFDPQRYWPLVLVGFLGKIFGPLGALWYAWQGTLPWIFGAVNITNDLIWLIPFGIILYHVFRNAQRPLVPSVHTNPEEAIRQAQTNEGPSVYELSLKHPVLVVFLRHSGCTFCRETVQMLAKKKSELEKQARLVIVHQEHDAAGKKFLNRYGLTKVYTISDPKCMLYRSFDLGRGTFSQLFGWRSWIDGFRAGILKKMGIGWLKGDGFQMPGAFLISHGQVVESYRSAYASDHPDYEQMVSSCELVV